MEVFIKIGGQAVSVEVTVAVCECLDRSKHKSENLAHKQRRHWDRREFDEYIVARESGCYSETPEQWLCRKETLQEIIASLENCTEVQRQRFLLFALDGLSYSEIGKVCGCSKYAVRDSIESVRKKCRDFFENGPIRNGNLRLTSEGHFALSHVQEGQAVLCCSVLLAVWRFGQCL